jgi:phage baseplate assembly protein W
MSSSADQAFLGRGWAFPPRFSPGGADVGTAAGPDDIRESLAILFATEPGERVMRADYGAGLRPMLFAEIDQQLIALLKARITTAVLFHEPRIALDRLDISEDASTPGLLSVSLFYTVRASNSRYNLVFPFYVKEASGPLR